MSEPADELLVELSPPRGRRRALLWIFLTVVLAFASVVGYLYRQVANLPNHMPADPRPVKNAPYIPTPEVVVATMLREAKITQDDVVVDLGCGDGRIPIAAAKAHGCRAVGYDIDPKLVELARQAAQEAGVADRVTFEVRDIFTVDLAEATVVMLYLLPAMNEKLVPQLLQLPPGARIVCHDFAIRGYRPDRVIYVPVEGMNDHMVHVWERPLRETAEERQKAEGRSQKEEG